MLESTTEPLTAPPPLHTLQNVARILALVYVAAAIGLPSVALLALHWRTHNILLHPVHTPLTIFCMINAVICIWEIGLWFHVHSIRSHYKAMAKKLPRGRLPRIFLFHPCTLSQAFSLRFWAEQVWGTYSIFDSGYSEPKSFGFNIDIGNGWTTLLPSLVFPLGMTFADLSGGRCASCTPRLIGFIGAVTFWQEMYGTFIYFVQYVVNRRWQEHGTQTKHIWSVVVVSNVIWVLGPALGLWASWCMVRDDSLDAFTT